MNDVIDAVDIAEMDYLATSALKKRIEEKVREMREVGGPALREEFAEKAAAIGMTIDEAPGRVPLGFAERGRVHGVRGWPFKTLPVLRLPDEC